MKLEKTTARITISRMRERLDQGENKQNRLRAQNLISLATKIENKVKSRKLGLSEHSLMRMQEKGGLTPERHLQNIQKNLHSLEYWRRRGNCFIVRSVDYTYIISRYGDLITMYDTIGFDMDAQ